jgi:hypothetical protein
MAIINDNDMEIIVKGSQEKVIQKMLKNRLFCMLEMPAQKPDKISSAFSSSIFVGFINDGLVRTFAIRDSGSKTAYENSEYYLSIYYERGKNPDSRKTFNNCMKRKKAQCISAKVPTIKELLSFLNGKELILITNYMHYGNIEYLKVNDFLEKLLLLQKDSESKFFRRVENCDIRIFLSHVNDEPLYSESRLYSEDIGNLDIGQRIVELLHKNSKYYFEKQYYSAQFEARSEGTNALYFATRFHSNTRWDADPVNIVNARITAFVLPGTVSNPKDVTISPTKITQNDMNGTEYMIDSIHFNSDIFFDTSEFEKFLDSYFCYFAYD